MELVAHGGTIFYSVHTHTGRDTHSFMHARKSTQELNNPPPPLHFHTLAYLHTHSHAPTRSKGALLFDVACRALTGFCFTPFVYLFWE